MRLIRQTLLAVALAAAQPAQAADGSYEERLLRLSEVLGALHFLRNLCGDPGNQWRDKMEAILAAENPEPERRARYVARFNRGYRAYAQGYGACTDAASAAIDLYMAEGEMLSRDIVTRYAN